ncbi:MULTISPECIES: hypothetical protein [unclassified Streptomyces]|uniref:hypothetical protein n=1 Tax=unclassified Streptomyces TaxID=2593676 RepID=UPI003648DE4B
MGLDLTLLMADWEYLSALPIENRIQELEDATWSPELDDDHQGRGWAGGWRWPTDRGDAWCVSYGFFTTTGSYRPHACAGAAWADMRLLVDSSVRESMDTFLIGLIWDPDSAGDRAPTGYEGFFPPAPDPWHPRVLLMCPPDAVSGKAQAWVRVESQLEQLRQPFIEECAGWAGRPDTFEDFTELLREWGGVTTEAGRHGWGLVGLP